MVVHRARDAKYHSGCSKAGQIGLYAAVECRTAIFTPVCFDGTVKRCLRRVRVAILATAFHEDMSLDIKVSIESSRPSMWAIVP